MDGLIFDTERIVKQSWDDVESGIPDMGEHIFHTIGFNRERREAYFRENISEDFPAEAFSEQTRRRFYEIAESEGVEIKPGVRELLKYGKQNGFKIALATSSRRAYAEQLLKDAGLYEYFDGFVFGDMVTHSKPDPEVYVRACEQIGLLPKQCTAFEDAPAGVCFCSCGRTLHLYGSGSCRARGIGASACRLCIPVTSRAIELLKRRINR